MGNKHPRGRVKRIEIRPKRVRRESGFDDIGNLALDTGIYNFVPVEASRGLMMLRAKEKNIDDINIALGAHKDNKGYLSAIWLTRVGITKDGRVNLDSAIEIHRKRISTIRGLINSPELIGAIRENFNNVRRIAEHLRHVDRIFF